jgi:hypothetical protein
MRINGSIESGRRFMEPLLINYNAISGYIKATNILFI